MLHRCATGVLPTCTLSSILCDGHAFLPLQLAARMAELSCGISRPGARHRPLRGIGTLWHALWHALAHREQLARSGAGFSKQPLQRCRRFVPCSKAVTGLQWSQDGRTLVSGSLDGHVIRWHVEHGTKARRPCACAQHCDAHCCAAIMRHMSTAPALLTHFSCRPNSCTRRNSVDRWQTSTWGSWCRASAQTSTQITYAWRLTCQGRRLGLTCKSARSIPCRAYQLVRDSLLPTLHLNSVQWHQRA